MQVTNKATRFVIVAMVARETFTHKFCGKTGGFGIEVSSKITSATFLFVNEGFLSHVRQKVYSVTKKASKSNVD
jgi:hypothetical protein